MDISNKTEWSEQDIRQLCRAVSEVESEVPMSKPTEIEWNALVVAVTQRLKEQGR